MSNLRLAPVLLCSAISERPRPVLGFCFSFPVDHQALDAGLLIQWTKGFENPGGVGQDPAKLLREAFLRQARAWPNHGVPGGPVFQQDSIQGVPESHVIQFVVYLLFYACMQSIHSYWPASLKALAPSATCLLLMEVCTAQGAQLTSEKYAMLGCGCHLIKHTFLTSMVNKLVYRICCRRARATPVFANQLLSSA